ncbi:MAG: hypothetical protein RR316_02745 [Clostridia bacterium]
MYNRINTLVKMQLADKIPLLKIKTISKAGVYLGLRILAMFIITVVMGGAYFFFNKIMSLRIDYNFMVFFIGVTQIISIIGNTNILINNLYLSKDNVILFALPARHNEVFISKIIVYYAEEFRKNLYLLVPALLAYALFASMTISYLLNILILIVFLPLISVLISALLSLPVMFIRNFIKTYAVVGLLFYLVAFGFVVWGLIVVTNAIPRPFRLLQEYGRYMGYVNAFIVKLNSYIFVFRNAMNMLFTLRSVWDYVIVFGASIALLFSVYFLAMPFYFKVVSGINGKTVRKKHVGGETVQKSSFKTFLSKEIKTIVRDSSKLTSYVFSILSFPLLMYVINSILGKMSTNDLGNRLMIGFNIIIGITLLTATNSNMATAITTEGAEFAVLKTAPSKTYKIAWAKLSINLVTSTITIIAGCLVLLFSTKIGMEQTLLLFFAFLFINTSHILWSFQYDLLDPYLNAYAITGNMNVNKNVGRSVLTGVLMAVGFAAFAMFFLMESYVGGWIRLLAVSFGFLVLRLVLLLWNMKVYFKRIEL